MTRIVRLSRPRQVLAIASLDWTMLRQDPFPLLAQILMAVLVAVLLRPGAARDFATIHRHGLSGIEHVIPGMAVLFTFFVVAVIGASIFREYGWQTWRRLRVIAADPNVIVFGKLVVPFAAVVFQFCAIFAIGWLVLDLRVPSFAGLLGVAGMIIAYALCVCGIGFMLTAWAQSLRQITTLANILLVTSGLVGGILVPMADLPTWGRVLARAFPAYWAMRGFDAILIDGTPAAALGPASVLALMALATFQLAWRRFRVEEEKLFLL